MDIFSKRCSSAFLFPSLLTPLLRQYTSTAWMKVHQGNGLDFCMVLNLQYRDTKLSENLATIILALQGPLMDSLPQKNSSNIYVSNTPVKFAL